MEIRIVLMKRNNNILRYFSISIDSNLENLKFLKVDFILPRSE